eukprot:4355810-Pleurochrysis_carterae.AAC.4
MFPLWDAIPSEFIIKHPFFMALQRLPQCFITYRIIPEELFCRFGHTWGKSDQTLRKSVPPVGFPKRPFWFQFRPAEVTSLY